ncbi:MAG: hypothetical protein RLZZ436_2528 [Planctomycetota bacterium]|jgi:hypothetical protein
MRKWMFLLFFTVLVPGSLWSVSAQDSAPAAAAPQPGRLTEEQLGEMLGAIGLQPKKSEQRYDFAFKMSYRGEEWKFSMSAVLSRNGESVWVMAWLDQIPQTSAEVPRTALLRLLAANDRLGEGKFFAYIPTNKRFVMQRVIPNRDLTNKKLMETLQDLASSVADEYPTWSVSNWAPKSEQSVAEDAASNRGVPANPTAASRSPAASAAPAAGGQPIRSSDSKGKFDKTSVN